MCPRGQTAKLLNNVTQQRMSITKAQVEHNHNLITKLTGRAAKIPKMIYCKKILAKAIFYMQYLSNIAN